jgi:hypothetical protein
MGLLITFLTVITGFAFAQYYSPPARLQAVPYDLVLQAEIENMPGVRYIEGQNNHAFEEDVKERVRNERDFRGRGPDDPLPPSSLLVLSGGGR